MGVPDPEPEEVKIGRPTLFRDEYVRIARAMSEMGATTTELAMEFGVNPQTIGLWRTKHQEFDAACVLGKEAADKRVAHSLYHKAIGYTYEAEEIYVIDKEVHREKVWKHVPPDTAACFIWLKNRRPGEWRDKHDVEVSVNRAEIKTIGELKAEIEKRGLPAVIDCNYELLEKPEK